MKNWFFLGLVFVFASCHRCDPPTDLDNGNLAEEDVNLVPYKKGEVYKFKHKGGFVIEFMTDRETRKERTFCEECCKYNYIYRVNTTTLTPNYPIFKFYFNISNIDTAYINCSLTIGNYGFNIPTKKDGETYFIKQDSLIIDSITYYNVFKQKTYSSSVYQNDSIRPDSLFYNYQYGILKIIMTNGEYYEIYR